MVHNLHGKREAIAFSKLISIELLVCEEHKSHEDSDCIEEGSREEGCAFALPPEEKSSKVKGKGQRSQGFTDIHLSAAVMLNP